MIKIDFHTHTNRLNRQVNTTASALIRMALSKGMDAIAITDKTDTQFDEIRNHPEEHFPGIKIREITPEAISLSYHHKPLYIIRGVEYRFPEGHFLAIGGESTLNTPETLEDALSFAKDNNILIGPAHPFIRMAGGCSRKTIEKYWENFSFVESFNALSSGKCNRESTRIAHQLGLPQLASSDDHRGIPGSSYTVLRGQLEGNAKKDTQTIKRAIYENQIEKLYRMPTNCFSKFDTFIAHSLVGKTLQERLKLIYRVGSRYLSYSQ